MPISVYPKQPAVAAEKLKHITSSTPDFAMAKTKVFKDWTEEVELLLLYVQWQ